jgi:hypothetical protein
MASILTDSLAVAMVLGLFFNWAFALPGPKPLPGSGYLKRQCMLHYPRAPWMVSGIYVSPHPNFSKS